MFVSNGKQFLSNGVVKNRKYGDFDTLLGSLDDLYGWRYYVVREGLHLLLEFGVKYLDDFAA